MIWTLIVLHTALFLSVRLPFVQSWLGGRVSMLLSETLGTPATVGRVDLGFFNRVIIDDVIIPDLQGDTLLRAGRLSVKASLLPLLEGRFDITSAQLFGAHVRLYQADSTSAPNYQFVIDALSSGSDTTATPPLNLHIGSLIVRHSSVSYDCGGRAATGPGRAGTEPAPTFDPAHVAVSDISTHLALKSLRPDTLDIHLKRLSLREQSGLVVEDFTTRLTAGPAAAHLRAFRLQLPRSVIAIDTLDATYDSDPHAGSPGLRRISETLHYQATLDATITPDDLSPLTSHLPPLTSHPSLLTSHPSPLTPHSLSLSTSVSGTSRSVSFSRLSVSSDGLAVRASGSIHADGPVPTGRMQLDQCDASAAFIARLKEVVPSLPDEVVRLGNIQASGHALRRHDGQCDVQATVSTTAGSARLLFAMDSQEHFTATIATDSLHLGRLTANADLGHIAANVGLSGTKERTEATAIVHQLQFKGHRYRGIAASGTYLPQDGHLDVRLAIDDPDLRADVECSLTPNSSLLTPHSSLLTPPSSLRLSATVGTLRPSALGLTDRWPGASISATVNADLTLPDGWRRSPVADATGHISLDNFTLRSATDSTLCHIDHLQADAHHADGHRVVKVIGDMGLCELSGQFDWGTLPHSLATYVASKLPTLPGLQSVMDQTLGHAPSAATAPNSFSLNLHLTDSRWLQPLLGIPLTLGQSLRLTATVDDRRHTIDMHGRLPAFTYAASRYRELSIDLTTLGDSALCHASLTKLNTDGGLLALNIGLTAADNNINTAIAWQATPTDNGDTLRATKGIINAVTQLHTNAQNRPEAHISVQPSQMLVGDRPWHIRPCHISYSDNRLEVDSFAISHGSQHLIIDGTASAMTADTLTADMNGIDIAYVQDLLDFHPVDFSGLLSGKVQATSLFSGFAAQAGVTVSDFRFQGGRMGTLYANARWNTKDSQIDIDAVADEGVGSEDGEVRGESRGVRGEGGGVRGYSEPSKLSPLTPHLSPPNPPLTPHLSPRTVIQGHISPVRSDIDLRIRAEGSNIEFCRSFTGSFLSDLSGQAYGIVELAGPLGDMNLTGLLTVDGQMTVTPLNTTYQLKSDTIRFVPNDIQMHGIPLTDRDGNTATLSGGIHHESLSDFTFDLDVATNGLLVYDFPTFGDSNICGTVHATGQADLHGRPGEITINCNVTPLAGSTFAYNAANPDAVSTQEFITWGSSPTPVPSLGGEGSIHHSSPSSDHSRANRESAEVVTTPLPPAGGAGGGADLRINFLVNATPEATLRVLMDANTGDYITLNGTGTIRAAFHNKGPFHMFGNYTVSRGTYGITIQNIIKKNFTFQQEGTIVFGGDPYDATLSLQAVHTVNGVSLSDLNLGGTFASNTVRVNCLMNITGTPSQPQVEFDLEMPTVNSEENQMIRSLIASEQEMNQQVLYLLGIGRFYTQGANNADAQQYGQTTLAMQSFLSGTVSTQINEVLSQVIKSNDWNFGANISTGDEGWNNAEYEGMVSGRLLNNRLLINGQFGYRDNATTTTPSFIGDFDLQYLLKRNGNLAVKVYNQTNDRYFTRSALNTQGVGLVMKKDFDGLRDLLRKKKKPKTESHK